MTARAELSSGHIAWLSLAAIAIAAIAPLLVTASHVTPFALGGEVQEGRLAQSAALLLGLTLGWGVPGLSLACLTRPAERDEWFLARAFGLGVGYIFLTGLVWATVTGAAPGRWALFAWLALPSLILLRRRPVRVDRASASSTAIVAILVFLLTVGLWPKLRHEAMSGDGTEAYELARSLQHHALPYWEIEGADPPRFGTPVTVPYFTGAYLTFAEMTVLGEAELAPRLAFVSSLAALLVTVVGLVARRGWLTWAYATGVASVYLLWNSQFVGYEAPVDLAEPAGTDTLTMALWMAGFAGVVRRAPGWGAVCMVLACATTYSAPLLSAIALITMARIAPATGLPAARAAAALAGTAAALLAVVGAVTGVWPDWWSQIRSEYWLDLVEHGRRVPATPLLLQGMLMTGLVPLAILLRWRALDIPARTLAVTAAVYLAIVLAGSYKNLHYLAPLPWLLLVPAAEAAGRRGMALGLGVLIAVMAASIPDPVAVRREPIVLGRETCVEGLSLEEAALASDRLYDVLDYPARGERFGVGKHTFVRYGLALGGRDCVIGLSRVVPSGAIVLDDRGPAEFWTRDVDRYARWRFAPQMPLPAAWLFPRHRPASIDGEAQAWRGPIDLRQNPGRALALEPGRRYLVPFSEAGPIEIDWPNLSADARIWINGDRVASWRNSGAVASVAGPWRRGWNVLTVEGAGGPAHALRLR